MGQENVEKRNDCQVLDCQLPALYDSTEDMDFVAELRRLYLKLIRTRQQGSRQNGEAKCFFHKVCLFVTNCLYISMENLFNQLSCFEPGTPI